MLDEDWGLKGEDDGVGVGREFDDMCYVELDLFLEVWGFGGEYLCGCLWGGGDVWCGLGVVFGNDEGEEKVVDRCMLVSLFNVWR